MNTASLIHRCRDRGATLLPEGGQLRVKGWSKLTEDLQEALREHKPEVLVYLRESVGEKAFDCWMLAEWRKVITPQRRRVLSESIAEGDAQREEYARWMLRDILLDPGYEESYQ